MAHYRRRQFWCVAAECRIDEACGCGSIMAAAAVALRNGPIDKKEKRKAAASAGLKALQDMCNEAYKIAPDDAKAAALEAAQAKEEDLKVHAPSALFAQHWDVGFRSRRTAQSGSRIASASYASEAESAASSH